MLTFNQVREMSGQRAARWHANAKRQWIPSDWSNAAAGEVGECCNAVKKLMRIRDEMFNISESARQLTTEEEAIRHVGKEAADAVLYLDLLCQDLGIRLEDFIVEVFNKKSEDYGFPERLSV